MTDHFVYKDDITIDPDAIPEINDFYDRIPTQEKELGLKIIIQEDRKTKVNFIECHIASAILAKNMDLNAVIDPDNQEDYRANRMLQPNNPYFKLMVEDARKGRQFSDIVVEYNNKCYTPEKPLKILGGQHRSVAIEKGSPVRYYHGVRIYFNLDVNKRVELYRISNTNIQVPDDLLDRLDEQSLKPPNTLRDLAHSIGLLQKDTDFGEKKSLDEPCAPTVRMLRTFVVNFTMGKGYKGDFESDAIEPYLCTVGGMDTEYKKVFDKDPYFSKQADLIEAGKQFVKLHTSQYQTSSKPETRGQKEFAVKALSLSVISSWAYAAGVLQRDLSRLAKLYNYLTMQAKKTPLTPKQWLRRALRI